MDKEKQNRRLERWKEIRQKGRVRFILRAGLLAWALPMFIVMGLVFGRFQKYQLTPTLIVGDACIWAVTGLIYGCVLWIWTEKRYQKLIAQRDATQQS